MATADKPKLFAHTRQPATFTTSLVHQRSVRWESDAHDQEHTSQHELLHKRQFPTVVRKKRKCSHHDTNTIKQRTRLRLRHKLQIENSDMCVALVGWMRMCGWCVGAPRHPALELPCKNSRAARCHAHGSTHTMLTRPAQLAANKRNRVALTASLAVDLIVGMQQWLALPTVRASGTYVAVHALDLGCDLSASRCTNGAPPTY